MSEIYIECTNAISYFVGKIFLKIKTVDSYLIQMAIAAFLFLTLPLIILKAFSGQEYFFPIVIEGAYFTLFGMSHFLLTYTIYLSKNNRNYFDYSLLNKWIYYYAPFFIFLFALFYYGLNLEKFLPEKIALIVLFMIRFANFYHVSRQSYGVLQLIKNQQGFTLHGNVRKIENATFIFLAIAQSTTSTLNHLTSNFILKLLMLVLVILYLNLIRIYLLDKTKLRSKNLSAIVYLSIQFLCGLLVVKNFVFYPLILAVHYLEYHLLFYPRLKRTLVQQNFLSKTSLFKIYFFLILLSAILVFLTKGINPLFFSKSTQKVSNSMHLFDGIFLIHFFLDAFIWRSKNSHWKKEFSI